MWEGGEKERERERERERESMREREGGGRQVSKQGTLSDGTFFMHTSDNDIILTCTSLLTSVAS